MGSSASKVTRAAPKRYPTGTPSAGTKGPQPPLSSTRQAAGTEIRVPLASGVKDEAIKRDAFDPQLASKLRHLGAVHPSPTVSYTSTAGDTSSAGQSYQSASPIMPDPSRNPAVKLLHAREQLANKAEEEFAALGRQNFQGKEFLDVLVVKQALRMRASGESPDSIERKLELKKGVIARLGPEGLVSVQ